jgi:hypothetical protein
MWHTHIHEKEAMHRWCIKKETNLQDETSWTLNFNGGKQRILRGDFFSVTYVVVLESTVGHDHLGREIVLLDPNPPCRSSSAPCS